MDTVRGLCHDQPPMSGVGTHEGLTHRKRLRGHDANALADHELETLVVELYTDWKGWAPYRPQARNLVATCWWLAGVLRHEGDEFHRSWPQVIRAIGRQLGWEVSGDVEALKVQITRTKRLMGYLQGMGLLDGWEAVYDSRGESSGIDFRASREARSLLHRQLQSGASPCSSTGATTGPPRRRERAHQPARISPEVTTPSGESRRFRVNLSPLKRDLAEEAVPAPHAFGEAGQQPAVDAIRRDHTATDGAALQRLRTAAGRAEVRAAAEGTDPLEAVRRVLRGASAYGLPSMAIGIVGWEAMRRITGQSMNIRLRPERYGQGLRELDVADRYGAFGDGRAPRPGEPAPGLELLLDLMHTSALWGWEPCPIESRHGDRDAALNKAAAGPVVSLAHFLCQVGQAGRGWRAHARERAGYNAERKGRRRGTAKARRRRGPGAC